MKTKFMQNKREKKQRFFQYNFFPKNRKADIPVTILVIGVFAVCSLALLTFFISAIKTRESFVGIDLMEKINSQIEENSFYGITSYSTDLEERNIQRVIKYAKNNILVGRTCNCGDKCNFYADMIIESSNNNGIPDPLLLLSLMMTESGCKSDVYSTSSWGLMQINSEVHCGNHGLPSNKRKCERELLNNVQLNIEVGAKILRGKYEFGKGGIEFRGCTKVISYSGWEAALRGYNGWGCNPDYPGQDNFVEEVMERYKELKKVEGGYLEKKETYLAPEWGFNWLKQKTLFSVKYNLPS